MAIFIGNSAANIIAGLAGNDLLDGLGGEDIINAGGGDDLAIGGEDDDTINGGSGNDGLVGEGGEDLINGGADNDILSGGADNDILSGGGGDDQIDGGANNDDLVGGSGNDTLTGGGGLDDDFQFNAPGEGVDTITDFTGETILVSAAGFGAGLNPGALPAADFFGGAGAAGAFVAANVRFLYNGGTGNLFFDPTGNGAGDRVQLATLTGAPTLTAADIDIVV